MYLRLGSTRRPDRPDVRRAGGRRLLDATPSSTTEATGTRARTTRFELLLPLLDLTTSLDPSFSDRYRFGAIFLAKATTGRPGRPDLAITLLKKALRRAARSLAIPRHRVRALLAVHDTLLRAACEWFRRAATARCAGVDSNRSRRHPLEGGTVGCPRVICRSSLDAEEPCIAADGATIACPARGPRATRRSATWSSGTAGRRAAYPGLAGPLGRVLHGPSRPDRCAVRNDRRRRRRVGARSDRRPAADGLDAAVTENPRACVLPGFGPVDRQLPQRLHRTAAGGRVGGAPGVALSLCRRAIRWFDNLPVLS